MRKDNVLLVVGIFFLFWHIFTEAIGVWHTDLYLIPILSIGAYWSYQNLKRESKEKGVSL